MYGAASPHDLEQSCNQIKTAINLTNPNSSCLPLSNRVLGVVAVPRRAKCPAPPENRLARGGGARQGIAPARPATVIDRAGCRRLDDRRLPDRIAGGGTISTFAMSPSGLPLPLRGSHVLQTAPTVPTLDYGGAQNDQPARTPLTAIFSTCAVSLCDRPKRTATALPPHEPWQTLSRMSETSLRSNGISSGTNPSEIDWTWPPVSWAHRRDRHHWRQ